MLPMPKYKNHMHVDYACTRERHALFPLIFSPKGVQGVCVCVFSPPFLSKRGDPSPLKLLEDFPMLRNTFIWMSNVHPDTLMYT